MAYTVEDLVNKFIEIEKRGDKFYKSLASDSNMNIRTKTLFKVFGSEEEKHAVEYESMLTMLGEDKNSEIDFLLYDKSQKILNNMKFDYYDFEGMENNEILNQILFIEKEFLALALSVQGIIVKSEADRERPVYKILSNIIDEEKTHISNIEAFL